MDEPYFTLPGEGERIGPYGHRVLAELPRLLNFHTPDVGFIGRLRE